MNEFANTVDAFKKYYGLVQLCVCDSGPLKMCPLCFNYEWKISFAETGTEETLHGSNCTLMWQASVQVGALFLLNFWSGQRVHLGGGICIDAQGRGGGTGGPTKNWLYC